MLEPVSESAGCRERRPLSTDESRLPTGGVREEGREEGLDVEGRGDEEGYPSSVLRSVTLIGVAICYVILLKPLGYLLSTPLFISGALLVLGERKPRLISSLAVVFTVVVYVIFAQMLNIRIPVGPFTGLFRKLGWIIL